jgi:hypothetical protein
VLFPTRRRRYGERGPGATGSHSKTSVSLMNNTKRSQSRYMPSEAMRRSAAQAQEGCTHERQPSNGNQRVRGSRCSSKSSNRTDQHRPWCATHDLSQPGVAAPDHAAPSSQRGGVVEVGDHHFGHHFKLAVKPPQASSVSASPGRPPRTPGPSLYFRPNTARQSSPPIEVMTVRLVSRLGLSRTAMPAAAMVCGRLRAGVVCVARGGCSSRVPRPSCLGGRSRRRSCGWSVARAAR